VRGRNGPDPRVKPNPGPSALHVMVVEDDAAVRAHALRVVSGLGHQVQVADGADAALAMLAAGGRCDLLMTDVVMPGMSGGRLALAARAMRPNLPVLFVTGHSDDPLVAQLRQEGAAVVLFKPYRRAALADAIRRAIGTD